VVILAAGASVRMGRPKLLLPWRGTSIIGHLIAQWRELGAAQIAVVCRPGDDAIQVELDRLAFPRADRIHNPNAGQGMFSSVQCAARWSGWRDALTGWAIVLGDQPHLQASTLRQLVVLHEKHPAAICQPRFEGRVRHPVILPRVVFTGLRTAVTVTLKDFLSETVGEKIECVVDDAGLKLDLDRPEDYDKALNLHSRTS
jgi:molybdenum cofactor cytidylyltransferase